jgi:tetratricopeptide (TPR) repeat protein
MPAAKPKFYFTLDSLLETPVVYTLAKTFLQLDPLLDYEATAAMIIADLEEKHGNLSDALRANHRALKVEPNNADAHLQRGFIYLGLEQAEDALQCFEKVVALDPAFQHGYGWTMLGTHLNNMHRYARAIPCFEKALELDRDSLYALNGYGLALYSQQRYWEAQTFLELALAQPNLTNAFKAEIRCNLGLALIKQEKYKKALHHLAVALKLNNKLVEAWCGKAQALLLLENYPAALDAVAQTLALAPYNLIALGYKSAALFNLERYEEALAVCDQLLKANPQDSVTWSERGTALARLNQFTEALTSCQRAIELDEQQEMNWLNFGFVLEKLEQYGEATRCYQKALMLKPDYQLAWNNLGMTNLQQFLRAAQQNELALAENHWWQAIEYGRKGKAKDWLQEECNFLQQAAAAGHYALVEQLSDEMEDNDLLIPLRHAMQYLQTRDLNVVTSLPIELRAQTEKIINQF